jgi:integrase
MYNYGYWLKNASAILSRSKKISQRDKQLVLAFVDHLKAQGIGTGRIAKHVLKIVIILEILDSEVEKAKRTDIEKLVVRLEERGFRPVTFIDYIFILKRFFKFVKYGNIDLETPYPEEVRWIKRKVKPNEMKKAEFLSPSEVKAMIVAASRMRDKAMIAVGFEGGFRTGELLGLNLGDIVFDEMGVRAKVRGKTGERIVRLISSTPLLARYLETHPLQGDPNAPLWLTEVSNWKNQRVSCRGWNWSLRYLGKKAGIKGKQVHSYLLRHGSATEAAKYLTDAEMKVRYGWTMNSGMPGVYVHLSAQDLDPKLARAYSGKPFEPTRPEFSPVSCVRCGEKNTPGVSYCGRCGTPLNAQELAKSSIEIEALKAELRDVKKLLSQLISQPSQGKKVVSEVRSA